MKKVFLGLRMRLLNKFVITGYPRSGNTFLSYAINQFFFLGEEPKHNHTVTSIIKSEKAIVSFRNPYDCISSWHRHQLLFEPNPVLLDDINFYIRFHKAVFDNLHKVVLMDFDYFTKDIDYIKSKVFENFGIGTDNNVTEAQVKEAMLANNKSLNLPRNNKEELDAVKAELQQMPEFAQCIELYERLKQI